MITAGVRTTESLNELEAHLRDDVEHSILSGLSAELAFEGAVQRLGGADALREEFTKWARERRRHFIYRGLVFGFGVFVLGVTFCYFVMLPLAMAALLTYMNWFGFSHARLVPHEYIRFAVKLVLGMSISFEIPVILLTLVKIGVINHRLLSRGRRYILVVNLLVGAVFAGPGVIPQFLMFALLQGLYEISAYVARCWACQNKEFEFQP